MKYHRHFSTRTTPQSEPIPGSSQVPNNAGGFAWEVDDWKRLDRFLILGSEGGTYYVGERKLTIDNANAALRCIKADGVRTVKRILEISDAGRAPKNDPALFVLAIAASQGDANTRKAAFDVLPKIARIGTHLFMFLENLQGFRGWGRGVRRAVANWYTQKDVDALAYQLFKYRQRNGWSHRDLLRKAHPEAPTPAHEALFRRVVANDKMGGREVARQERKGGPMVTKQYEAVDVAALPALVSAFEKAQSAESAKDVIRIIEQNPNLSWEMIPTEFLGKAEVWEVLLPNMKPTALIRNLGRLTANGLIAPLSTATKTACEKITNGALLRKERVHPIAILTALSTYRAGHGAKGDLVWNPVASIINALDSAFYTAFGNITPTENRFMLCLDLSGSMGNSEIAGIPGLTPRLGAAAMALVTAATEPNHVITGFTAIGEDTVRFPGKSREDLDLAVSALPISPRQRLDDVMEFISSYSSDSRRGAYRFGGTDCSLPMRYALQREIPVDLFVVYTDSQTWAGDIHPSQALLEYRRKMGIPAKLVVVGMVANEFSIADPNDAGMLDVVGFDTAAPQLISDFACD